MVLSKRAYEKITWKAFLTFFGSSLMSFKIVLSKHAFQLKRLYPSYAQYNQYSPFLLGSQLCIDWFPFSLSHLGTCESLCKHTLGTMCLARCFFGRIALNLDSSLG